MKKEWSDKLYSFKFTRWAFFKFNHWNRLRKARIINNTLKELKDKT